ncbi:hypothetical protein DID88_002037 [Monilinia fructigena]|uniref:Zn(2)-C6 fungal-type domain-containing protein n=1 Tax=Monilinia fructigena TaxID=38457 RepID=A0A395IW93_9HELO|nr:hypothetical protein DID88_002037 [Monilinia fructigena]
MRNARACEACRASKNRCFFVDDHTICQRCHQTKAQCIVREKARPRRARGARRAGRLEPPKVEDSSLSSNTSICTENPLKDGEFSLDLPTTTHPFRDFNLKGLVDSNGIWTVEAKRAYMGCYVLGSHLSRSFNKPQIMSYDNLLPSNCDSFIPSIRSTPATAMVILERISDRINDTWTAKTTRKWTP